IRLGEALPNSVYPNEKFGGSSSRHAVCRPPLESSDSVPGAECLDALLSERGFMSNRLSLAS
ncbi:hypothetical protein BaRGS_00008287, partial [Batillaria attramentaria]